jgi:hypothetical protein
MILEKFYKGRYTTKRSDISYVVKEMFSTKEESCQWMSHVMIFKYIECGLKAFQWMNYEMILKCIECGFHVI